MSLGGAIKALIEIGGGLLAEAVKGFVKKEPPTRVDQRFPHGTKTEEALRDHGALTGAAGRSMVADDPLDPPSADEAPSFGNKPWPSREDLN